MKRIVILCLSALVASSTLMAQTQQQTDTEKARRNAEEAAFNSRVDNLRNTGKQRYIRDRYKDTRIYQDNILPLYRDLKKDEIKLLEPSAADVEKYSEYVGQKRKGIVKLIADKGCDLGPEFVVAADHCEKYSMPGAGSSYSFRSRMYRIKRLADISFVDGTFGTKGVWKHGILISLGNVPLGDLNAQSKELETLFGFQAEMDVGRAGVFESHLANGIAGGQIVYKDSHPATTNTTYVIRSIAYRGEHWEAVKNVEYDELEFDKRRDVIVAFRVVRLVPEESVTIIWKLLSDKKAPKLTAK